MNDLKIKELVLKIMNKAIEKTATTASDISVNFSGHVSSLNVYVHINGYIRGNEEFISKETYLDPSDFLSKEDIINNLQDMYDLIYSL